MGPGLKKDKRDNIREEWVDRLRGLYKRWMFHMIDAPQGATIHQLSQDFDGEGLIKLRRWDSDVIRETFGVNPEIFGEVSGSNRATSQMAKVNYREQVVVPRMEYRLAVFQHEVLPLYRSPRPLVADYELAPLEDAELALEHVKAAPFAASLGDHRRFMGLPVRDGDDEVHFVPLGVSPRRLSDVLSPPAYGAGGGTPAERAVRAVLSRAGIEDEKKKP